MLVSPAFTPAYAQSAATLDRVVVIATRLEGVSAFDVPASVDMLALEDGGARSQAALSEALDGVPGLLARERQNLAQDTQLSIRGFGARSTFGVRGLRLYADGVPATMPDGQGQVSHFNMLGADRVEVLRGPFSALHGNSSGGVIQLWSDVPGSGHEARMQGSVGSHDSTIVGARLRGASAGLGYSVAASVLDVGGYRDHSAARRESLNAKLRLTPGAGTLDLLLNHFNAPDAQDPLGLTRAQAWQDPSQASPVAKQYDTRKSVRQDQLGLVYDRPFDGGHRLRAMAYGGRREVEQYLALPMVAQANPLNAGGVIDLDNEYGGADLRWSWTGDLAGRPFELSIGANGDRQRQHRRGYENFVGTALGVRGALRRDERNEVWNADQYVQAWWQLAERWSLLVGARHSRVGFRSEDDYITAGNPDDSGRVVFERTTPVAGVMFSPAETLRLYASLGRGFETPTFNEIGYRADGGAGLAFDLRPATSRNAEVGMKWRSGHGARVEAAFFRADTDDELAVARNVGGRSSFRNVGAARRQGVEIQADLPLHDAWQLQVAYTWLDATFRDSFPICTTTGCTSPGVQVDAGTRIPGVARQQASMRLRWQGHRWAAAAQWLAVGDVTVNDTGSERAPGCGLLNLEVVRDWAPGRGRLQGFARVDNALDRFHIGSVIVNEGNGRFYEPGPDRTVTVGLRWHWAEG
ncbi:TonB-dependent receptor [Pseudoxanthomonas sp. PXM02]|uniref:TonB-dependent receptor family protein n=1 Tax=Pseudoxanthomonas sp. PXM02 TaxID=2769294 RepID=UPI001CE1EEE0|nr:TonB-dependent receptor [Pseudoxanthomonas sp. PXM02]